MEDIKAVIASLAPQGELRVALNYGNTVLVQRGQEGPLGVAPDLARELARRLGLVPRFISYDAAAKVAAAVDEDAWNIAFMAIDPKRGEKIDFTQAYVLIEGTYMVKENSPWQQVNELDQSGLRLAVGQGAAYDLFLSRHLTSAELVKFPTSAAAIHGFIEQDLDAAAGVRQTLEEYAAENQGYRILSDHFTAIHQAMALPKGRSVAVQYVSAFIQEMKDSGFIAESLERSGQKGAAVAH